METIPHQLHLTALQAKKMVNGMPVNIPLRQMGSDKGEEVVYLGRDNAKKLLSSFKKGKGMRLKLSPNEIKQTMISGRGVNVEKAFKKAGSKIKKGFNKEIVDSGVGKEIASRLIDIGADVVLPAGTTALSMALGDPTGLSGAVVGKALGDQIQKSAEKKGYGAMSPEQARKEYMRLIRSMRGKSEAEKEAIKGSGFFKTVRQITGMKKKDIIDNTKIIGKEVVNNGSMMVGQAITAYTGNPVVGQAVASSLQKAGNSAIDSVEPSKSKYGVKFDPKAGLRGLKEDAKMYAVEAIDRKVDATLSPEMRAIAENVLVANYPNAEPLVKDLSEKKKLALQNRIVRGSGVKIVKKSNVKKSVVKAERAMKKAGVEQSPIETPSDFGFMSPYIRLDSPANHPFVPKVATQSGGTDAGYGNMSMDMARDIQGAGLYGGGLYSGYVGKV